jgi:antirestriction protein
MTTYAEWHEQETELDETEYEALTDYLDNEHKKETDEYDEDTVRKFHEAYMGQWDSMAEFVEENHVHDIPNYILRYIDWELMAQDWVHDYWESDNGHIFRAY